ncbi:hypothetical protein DFH06DRAFT_1198734 [Mycena polygramma]|nr:hypothetical protein DFH06DRAFT_1198734 [Mycena polygramma]
MVHGPLRDTRHPPVAFVQLLFAAAISPLSACYTPRADFFPCKSSCSQRSHHSRCEFIRVGNFGHTLVGGGCLRPIYLTFFGSDIRCEFRS